jgi:hypothetical protein
MKRAGWWTVLAAVLVAGAGLAGCESGKPFQVVVRLTDAETGRPVTGGEVKAEWTAVGKSLFPRKLVTATYRGPLDADGVARFEASTSGGDRDRYLIFGVDHPDPGWDWHEPLFFSDAKEIATRGEIVTIPASLWHSIKDLKVQVRVPPGFRGLVRVMPAARGPDGGALPGWIERQRLFVVAVDANGVANMPSHPVLLRSEGRPNQYAFGTLSDGPLDPIGEAHAASVSDGVWVWPWPSAAWLDAVDVRFIGTRAEYVAKYAAYFGHIPTSVW